MPPVAPIGRASPHSPTAVSGDYSTPAPDLSTVEYGQDVIRRGMSGESVKRVQEMLVRAGFPLSVDGKFGPKTEAAVRAFQQQRGLEVDGVVGSNTINAFESSFDPSRPHSAPDPNDTVVPNRPSRPTGPLEPPRPVQPSGPTAPSGPAGRYEQMALQKHGQAFVDRAKQIAQSIGAKPEWLFAVMHNESGMRTDAVNPRGGATGLIQFMPATARGLGTTTEALKNMTALQQLDYVEKYYQPFAGKINSGADLYLATFYPAAMGKSDDWVLGSQNGTAHTVARYNPIFDLDKDGQISAGEFRRYYNRRFPELAG